MGYCAGLGLAIAELLTPLQVFRGGIGFGQPARFLETADPGVDQDDRDEQGQGDRDFRASRFALHPVKAPGAQRARASMASE